MTIEESVAPAVPVRRAVTQVCPCGTNKQCHSIFVALTLIGGLLSMGLMVTFVIMVGDSSEGDELLALSIVGLVLSLIHLVFLFTAVYAEVARSAKCMRVWSVYTIVYAVLNVIGGIVGVFVAPAMIVKWVGGAFMSVLLAILSSRRYKELLLENKGEGHGFVGIQQREMDNTTSAPEEKRDCLPPSPPRYSQLVV